MKGKNSPDRLLAAISKLDVVEFLGVCKILGLKLYDEKPKAEYEDGEITKIDSEVVPREFEVIWEEMCDVVWSMNRTRRRNLGKLVYAAIGKDKEK